MSFCGSFAGALFVAAVTSVTTGRTLSVTNGIVTSLSTAFGSRAQRTRTCTKRPGGDVIGPGAGSTLLHADHGASGDCVLPERVDSSRGPLACQLRCPYFA